LIGFLQNPAAQASSLWSDSGAHSIIWWEMFSAFGASKFFFAIK
jgi:hypothetical protein